MAIINTLLTTSPANIFVSSGNTVVSTMYFCNTTGASVNLNVYLIGYTGGNLAVADGNVQIYHDVLIAGGDTFVVDMEKLVLSNTDLIQANATNSVTATVSYVGI